MFGLANGGDHVFDFRRGRVVGDDCLVLLEAHLGAADALDRKQCGPHCINAALSRHALDDQRHRCGLLLRDDQAAETTRKRDSQKIATGKHEPKSTPEYLVAAFVTSAAMSGSHVA